MATEFFECQCYSDEHTLKFTYDPQDDELYASVYLSQYRNFFQRIWTAVRYVFGYRSRYGHWDCFTLQREDAERLRGLLDQLIAKATCRSAAS
jgi:hypothetical protein